MENEQAKFEGWAIVEMMGHQREIGYVTTEAYGVAVLFRVDVPDIPAHEFVLRRPEYGDNGQGSEQYLPVGTKVKRSESPARSRLISPAAVYAINPCTEEAARESIAASSTRKLICLELPKDRAPLLTAPAHPGGERICEECGGTPEDGHSPRCSFSGDEDFYGAASEDILEGESI